MHRPLMSQATARPSTPTGAQHLEKKKTAFLVFIFYISVLPWLGHLQHTPMTVCLVPTPDALQRSPARGSLVGTVGVDCPRLGDVSPSWLPFPVQCRDLQRGPGCLVASPG